MGTNSVKLRSALVKPIVRQKYVMVCPRFLSIRFGNKLACTIWYHGDTAVPVIPTHSASLQAKCFARGQLQFFAVRQFHFLRMNCQPTLKVLDYVRGRFGCCMRECR